MYFQSIAECHIEPLRQKDCPFLDKIDLGYRRNEKLMRHKTTSAFSGDETEWRNEWLMKVAIT